MHLSKRCPFRPRYMFGHCHTMVISAYFLLLWGYQKGQKWSKVTIITFYIIYFYFGFLCLLYPWIIWSFGVISTVSHPAPITHVVLADHTSFTPIRKRPILDYSFIHCIRRHKELVNTFPNVRYALVILRSPWCNDSNNFSVCLSRDACDLLIWSSFATNRWCRARSWNGFVKLLSPAGVGMWAQGNRKPPTHPSNGSYQLPPPSPRTTSCRFRSCHNSPQLPQQHLKLPVGA